MADHRRVGAFGDNVDLYAVLGLKKECSDAELRLAYRRLAMTWHPDRCSASGSSGRIEEAKERFQEIQSAYSVLSDSGKRLLYDVGVYDSHGKQDVSGMGDFFGEMAEMMSQATPTDSFEELQQLFVDMFQADLVAGGFACGFGGVPPTGRRVQAPAPAPSPSCTTSGSTSAQARPSCNKGANKRCSPAMGSGMPPWTTREDESIGGRKKKQRLSTGHGVSSYS